MATALTEGTWEPSPVRRVEIPKPSGSMRRLGIPVLTDRIVERALLAVLDPEIDPILLPWSFAYRRGLGVKDAVAALTSARDTGMDWVARADIEDCFERIPQWEVMRRLREVVEDERVVHLVGRLLDRPVIGGRRDPGDRGRGLHQGSVLSPLLSNLYLNTFDRRMLAAGYRVIRYGDDFAIPVASRLDGEKALRSAATELSDLRLELNTGKCLVVSFEEGVRFLGETVTASTLAAAETLSHPLETVVYVDRPGAMVRTRGDRLVVTDADEALRRLSLRRVRQVVCFGRVGLTTPFLHRAAEQGIEVVLLSEAGTLGGRLTAPCASVPTARRAQYRAADDEPRARRLAAAFIAGKIDNLRVSLLRLARRADDSVASESADRLARSRAALDNAESVDVVLGLEGSASREYFQGFPPHARPGLGVPGPATAAATGPGQRDAPLTDTRCCATRPSPRSRRAGLDPMVGFLHQHRWGRPALALDLMEEFRPMTVDVAVWRCISTAQVRPEQFTTEPDTGCRMGDDARHTFLAAYERRMLTLCTHPPSRRRVSYRVAIHLQAKALARSLVQPDHPYRALRWK